MCFEIKPRYENELDSTTQALFKMYAPKAVLRIAPGTGLVVEEIFNPEETGAEEPLMTAKGMRSSVYIPVSKLSVLASK